jgi:hypothetical protein
VPPLTAIPTSDERRRAAMLAADWRCQTAGCTGRAAYVVAEGGTVHCGIHATPPTASTAAGGGW